jgi:nicotinate-nucleotide adenylyltransferase
MLNTLCVGGSFNPIHHGHLICARAAAESGNFDRVLLIPSSQPPHKPGDANLAEATHRVAMTQAAIHPNGNFSVDPLETLRTGPSFTLDTARELMRRGTGEVNWLIGADLLPQFHTWHEPQALMKEIKFWVIQRPGSPIDWAALPPLVRPLRERVLQAPLIDISATDIRQRVAMGRPIDFLTPPAVIAYIEKHGLYRRQNVNPQI